MTHLSLPRVHFLGKFTVNHTYVNNISDYHDAARVKLKPGVTLDPISSATTAGETIPGVELDIPDVEIPFPFPGAVPSGFNELQTWRQSVHRWFENRYWNIYGNNAVTFADTTITGVELPSGELITDATQDGLIGAKVELLGSKYFDRQSHAVLVDLSPYGVAGSQIYSGLFRLSKGGELCLEGSTPHRANSIWLHWFRNLQAQSDIGASAVWQTALPNDTLTFADPALQVSPALTALQQLASSGQGLVARYCTFFLAPGNTRPRGGVGPSHLLLVGTIGGWSNGQPASIPTGRLLYPNTGLTIRPLGPVIAKADHQRRVLTFDFITAVPETIHFDITNRPATDMPEKANWGNLNVGLRPGGNPTEPLVPLGKLTFDDYNKAAYLKRAGIIELPYPQDLELETLDQGNIEIVSDLVGAGSPTDSLVLSEVRANIFSGDRNVYLSVGETATITVQALERGNLPPVPLTVTLDPALDLPPQPGGRLPAPLPKDNVVKLSQEQITIGSNGKATFTIEGRSPGIRRIEFATDGTPTLELGHSLRDTLNFYVNVRVLPEDNFDDVDDETIWNDWMFMYRNFFAYYDIVYPAMSRIIDFSNPNAVAAGANPTMIKVLTAHESFESTLYMPVSRDMSRGKRKLLFRWCSLAESGGPSPANP